MHSQDDFGSLPVHKRHAAPSETAFSAKTGAVHLVTLSSTIQFVEWSRPVAAENSRVELAVETHWVGDGAPLTIDLRDARGRTHATLQGRIVDDRFRTEVLIPENVHQGGLSGLFAYARIPDLGLEAQSAPLHVVPRLRIRDAEWAKGTARDGETVGFTARIASREDTTGWPAEVTVYEHSADGAHEAVTTFQATVEEGRIEGSWQFGYDAREPIVTQSEHDELAASYGSEAARYERPSFFFRVEVLGVTSDSDLLLFEDGVAFQVVDEDGTTYEGMEVALRQPDGSAIDRVVDAEGWVRVEEALPGRYEVIGYTLPERMGEENGGRSKDECIDEIGGIYTFDRKGYISFGRMSKGTCDLLTLSDSSSSDHVQISVEPGPLSAIIYRPMLGRLDTILLFHDDEESDRVFRFLARNTIVEWSQVKFGLADSYVSTQHKEFSEGSGLRLQAELFKAGITVRSKTHTHPAGERTWKPSGFGFHPRTGEPFIGDRVVAEATDRTARAHGLTPPEYFVFHVPSGRMIRYTGTYYIDLDGRVVTQESMRERMRAWCTILLLGVGLSSCVSVDIHREGRQGVVNRVLIEDEVLFAIIDDYKARVPIGSGRSLLAIRIEARDTSRVAVSAPDRAGFVWYQTRGTDAPIGYLEIGQVEVVIFGDEVESLFRVMDEEVKLEYLRKLKEEELDYLPIWDPYGHIYRVKNGEFEFENMIECSIFSRNGC